MPAAATPAGVPLKGLAVLLPSRRTVLIGLMGIPYLSVLNRSRSAALVAVEQLEHFATPVTYGEVVTACAADRPELVSHSDLLSATVVRF